MKRQLLATLALLVAMPALAVAMALDIFPDSDIGRRAAAYIEAFNSGSEAAMRTFIIDNVARKGLEQRPVEERLGIYRQMRDEHKTLTPLRRVGASDSEIEIIARTGGGDEMDLTFMFEAEAPHGLMGIRIMDAGPGGAPPDAGPSTPLPDDQAAKAWGAWLDSLTRADQFSGTVLFVKGDQVLFQHAYGLASRKDKTRNTLATCFNLGSINKLFTMLAIAQLVDQGKVKLDDTIDRYLPDYPRQVASKVTVRQLLEHKGGIGDIFGDTYDAADHSKLRTVADWIPLFRDKPLAFEPGTSQQYSNGGYVLLGAIVEKASGEDYYDYIRRHIYGPIGMKHTDSYAEDEAVPNRARGYTRHRDDGATPDASGWADNLKSRPMRGSPAGGGYSTLEDMLAFTRAVRGGKLVSSETVASFPMLRPDAGIGFGGGAPGINAGVEMSGPYTIITLTNMDPPTAEGAIRKLRSMLPGPSGNMKRVTIPHAKEGHGTSSSHEGGAPAPGQTVTRVAAQEGSDASIPPGATVIRREAGSHEPIPPGATVVRREGGGEAPAKSYVPEAGVDVAMTYSHHLPTVQVMVNGKGPFRFGIDTGGGGSLRIDSTLAVTLGLEKVGQVRGGDPSGKNARVMDLVSVESVEIGGAKFEGMNAPVRSYNERRRDEPIDGILGFSLFRDCLLTLDYPANRLRIDRGELPPPDGDQVIPFTLRHGIPSVRLQIDSLTVDADVDAGSMGGLSLPIALASKLPLATALKVVGHARTVSNEFEIQGAELNGSAKLGRWELSHPMLDFQPLFPMGNVGSRVLQDFKVTFDQKLGRMRLVRRA